MSSEASIGAVECSECVTPYPPAFGPRGFLGLACFWPRLPAPFCWAWRCFWASSARAAIFCIQLSLPFFFGGLELGLGPLLHEPGLADGEDVWDGPVEGEGGGEVGELVEGSIERTADDSEEAVVHDLAFISTPPF